MTGVGAGLAGLRVLDLYAGSGAVGLEAASRGAAHVLLVEQDPRAAAASRANAVAVDRPGVHVVTADVGRFTAARRRSGPDDPHDPDCRDGPDDVDDLYDVAFLDPPYDVPAEQVGDVVAALAGGWLRAGAVVVVERSSRDPDWQWPAGVIPDRARRYGEGTLWYGRAASPDTAGPDHP
jgi:16S rRNA (guanine966-N2)-methyltransferase